MRTNYTHRRERLYAAWRVRGWIVLAAVVAYVAALATLAVVMEVMR